MPNSISEKNGQWVIIYITSYLIRLWLYICSYCNWDTSVRKFAYSKENELSMVIEQVKEHSNKGYLKKMYDSVIFKLKEREGLSTERIE
jgi:hypothetical protein